jgi:hypothetical protein
MILAYRVVLRTICADLRYDFSVLHGTNSLPGNKMYVVRLKKLSLQKFAYYLIFELEIIQNKRLYFENAELACPMVRDCRVVRYGKTT